MYCIDSCHMCDMGREITVHVGHVVNGVGLSCAVCYSAIPTDRDVFCFIYSRTQSANGDRPAALCKSVAPSTSCVDATPSPKLSSRSTSPTTPWSLPSLLVGGLASAAWNGSSSTALIASTAAAGRSGEALEIVLPFSSAYKCVLSQVGSEPAQPRACGIDSHRALRLKFVSFCPA